MANYTVPSQHGEQIPLQTQDRDHLSALDVVWANKYEGEKIDPTHAMEMEFEFYRGAPPQWLNFYWAEHENSQFVERDMYQKLKEKINETKMKRWNIAHINLFHDPGSGGSTLAMQVLWDLRKELRCAKLLDSLTDTKAISQQVLRLFRAGGSEKQNTVLLLLDNKYTSEDASFRENLEKNIINELKVNNITSTISVVIILNCFHHTGCMSPPKKQENVNLLSSLSEKEHCNFKRKQSDIIQRCGNIKNFHAFNIIVSNYDPAYVTDVCSILQPFKEKGPRRQQLLAFLALINSYVPGSHLPHDLFQKFLRGESNDLDDFSLKQHMQPFTDFLVIFSAKEGETRSEDKQVRMVHPMIAHECMKLLTEVGVTRSDTALTLLRKLCSNTSLLTNTLQYTLKKLFTYRETTTQGKESFSKLIQYIRTKENPDSCVTLLQEASVKLDKDPFFPQALGRFFYLVIHDYDMAESWAREAIRRDTENSYIRDTLGQVHKHRLKNETFRKENVKSERILQIGKNATEAFETETAFAKKEQGPELQEHGKTRISNLFNYRGFFGYMEVAYSIFDNLTRINGEWSKVLTMEITLKTFLNLHKEQECEEYLSLITSLRSEVEKKFTFFEWYLLYSKPSIHKDEKEYIWDTVVKCYSKFITESQQTKSTLQMLKEKKASTFAGLLRTQDQETELELITEQWKKMYLDSPSDVENIQNYIVANIMLSQKNDTSPALKPLEELQSMLQKLWTEQKDRRSPEFYLLVLLLFWPDAHQSSHNSPDISECVRYMHRSFETKYKNYLRSRYLVPLFFLKIGSGLQRLIHMSCLDKFDLSIDLLNEGSERAQILQLRRVTGEVENYKVFFVEGFEKIEVSPSHAASVRGQGKVSFYLGFNIKEPVAYNIRYEQ